MKETKVSCSKCHQTSIVSINESEMYHERTEARKSGNEDLYVIDVDTECSNPDCHAKWTRIEITDYADHTVAIGYE